MIIYLFFKGTILSQLPENLEQSILILQEMMTRSICKLIQEKLRSPKNQDSSRDELVIGDLNILLRTYSNESETEERKTFWESLLKDMQTRFPSNLNYTLPWIKNFNINLGSLFLRISNRLGIQWKKEIYDIIEEGKLSSTTLGNSDLITITPIIHNLKILLVFPILELVQTSDDMEMYYKRQLAIYSNEKTCVKITQTLADQVLYKGNYKEALVLFEQLKEKIEKIKPPQHPDIATIHHILGKLYHLLGNYKKSKEFLMKALEIRENNQDQSRISIVLESLAQLSKTLGKYEEVEAFATKALKIYKDVLKEYHPDSDLKTGTFLLS